MKIMGIFEAKTHLSEIVRSGLEVCLTNRGKEVAVIVPFEKYQLDKVGQAFTNLKILKQRIPVGDFQDIIDMRNEGRK